MENEGKILEVIGRQREDIIAHMDKRFNTISEQNSTIIKKLEAHDDRFDRIETAVLENNKDTKDIKSQLDTAVTNHEQRIRKLEEKVSI